MRLCNYSENPSTVQATGLHLLGRAQPAIPPNLYSLLFMNIKAWGPQPQVSHMVVQRMLGL